MALPVATAHEVLPGLWLGNRNAVLDPMWLEEKQINAVFNCTKDIPFALGDRRLYRIPVDDSLLDEDIRNLELWSWEATYKVAKELKDGNRVLVHCAAGMQRSAAVVAMYCISQYRCSADESVAFVKRKRPVAFLGNVNFARTIKGFQTSFSKFIQERNLYNKMGKITLPP